MTIEWTSSRWRRALLATAVFLVSVGGVGCDRAGVDIDGFDQEPFPEYHEGKTIPLVSEMRLTPHAFDFFEQQTDNLIEELMDGGLSFCVPPTESGDIEACHEDVQCDDGSVGCQVDLDLKDLELQTEQPGQLAIDVTIDGLHMDEELAVTYQSTRISSHDCWLDLYGDSSDEPAEIPTSATLEFSVEHESPFDDIRLDVEDVIIDIDGVDYTLHNRSTLQGCTSADWLSTIVEWFRDDLLKGMVADEIDDQIDKITRRELCRGCDDGDGDCPASADCVDDGDTPVCMYDQTSDLCAPALLGLEGMIRLEELIGGFLPGQNQDIYATARLADEVSADDGLSFGVRAGAQPDIQTVCVPVDDHDRPSFDTPPGMEALNSDVTPDGDEYMFGFGIHERALEHLSWSAWASGTLCVEVGPGEVDLLTTSNVAALLDGVEVLSLHEAPMAARLTPQNPPELKLGQNEVVDGEVVDGLVTLKWSDLDLHLYGYIQERYARLLTLRIDTELPIAVVPDGNNAVLPVFGDFTEAVEMESLQVRDNALVMVDETDFELLLPALLGNAVSPLISAVSDPIELPGILGYQPVFDEDNFGQVEEGYIGLFASLEHVGSTGGQLREPPPQAVVEDHRVVIDEPAGVSVVLDVAAEFGGVEFDGGDVDYLYRLQPGGWHPAGSGDQLVIDDPRLRLQGEHRLELKAGRSGEASRWQPTPTTIDVIVDDQPPQLRVWQSGDTVAVSATDNVDAEHQLQLRHRIVVDDAPREWTRWSSVAPIDLEDLSDADDLRVDVDVRDRTGNLATESLHIEQTTPLNADEPAAESSPGPGCTATSGSVGGFTVLLFVLLVVASLRRRRRWQSTLVIVAACSLSMGGCQGEISTTNDCEGCAEGEACVDGECIEPACEVSTDCIDLVCSSGNEAGICEDGQCRCGLPCDRECGTDEYCCYDTKSCKALPDPCENHSCGDGQVPTPVDPGDFDPETCETFEGECSCEPVAPINIGYHGSYPSIDEGGDVVALSVYNLTYGDLMVGIVDGDTIEEWHFVDGIPEGGTVEGDPTGPRDGIVSPGPRIGTHTATAVDDEGRIHVLYRHEDDGSLRYARSRYDGDRLVFDTTTVDDDGDTGYFTDVAIRGQALEMIYTARTTGGESEVRHRTIGIDMPMADVSDTVQEVVHTGSATESPLEGYPHIAGLFLQLVVDDDGELFMSLYDNTRDRVGWLTEDSGQWSDITFLDALDAGPYASARPDDNGTVHVAYMDGSDFTLKYYVENADADFIADGVRDIPDAYSHGPVGHDVQLHLNGDDNVEVFYHDASTHELKRAVRTPIGDWDIETLAGDAESSERAHGMFPRAIRILGQQMVVDFSVDTTDANNPIGEPTIRSVD